MRAKTTHSGVSNKTEAEYEYFPTGQPRRLVLVTPKAQGVDYRYNTRDWLIHINHHNLAQSAPSQDNNDRFGINIGYDDQQNNGLSGTPIGLMLGADPYYNGNVSWVMYRIQGVEHHMWGFPTERVGYVYRYDKANRLTRGEFAGELYGEWFGGNAYNERDITYHKNGNLTGLKRYDQYGTVLHDYSYVYYNNTNRLRRVTGSGNNYDYDHNGNMIQDLANGIGYVLYDIHNLPVRVFTTGGAPRDYAYDHNGNRVRKYNGVETNYYLHGIDGRTEIVTDKASTWATYNLYGLDLIGQVRREGATWNRYYFLKDHLGSIRVTVNASGNVVAYDDYYPFGMQMPGRTQDSSAADGRYKFTGKERDTETKYDYFGARFYDARICRWLQVDPMAEKHIGWSPYVYCLNNPLRYIDKYGKQTAPVAKPTYRGYYSRYDETLGRRVVGWNPDASKFGMTRRTIGGDLRPHHGVDIIAPIGTPTYAIADGNVVVAGDQGGPLGKMVIIEFTNDKGEKRYAVYAHLSEVTVSAAEKVEEGQLVGKTGMTGNAASLLEIEAHLHFEIRHDIGHIDPNTGQFIPRDDPVDYFEIEYPEEEREDDEE